MADKLKPHANDSKEFMTGKKYDYSNELASNAPQSENGERKAEA